MRMAARLGFRSCNPTPTASFIVDRSFVEINDGQGVVNFTNTSENGDIWHWNFGDVGAAGNHSTEMSPSYNYTHSVFIPFGSLSLQMTVVRTPPATLLPLKTHLPFIFLMHLPLM